MHVCCVLSVFPIQTKTFIYRHKGPFLTSHTAQYTTRFHVLCCGHGRHSYICVHMEGRPHIFANSYLLELCGNLQHWKLLWTLKGVPDTSTSDVCPKHLVSAVFPWSLAIFCYFSLNSPYYLHNNNNNSKLNQLDIDKEPHTPSWEVTYSQKWRDLCFQYRVKPFLHATIKIHYQGNQHHV